MLVLAAIYLAVRPQLEPPPMPDDPIALARRLRVHPADWRAAAGLTESALDARVPRRFALWRAAQAMSVRLAPTRQATRMDLARAAFFHWTELSPADRGAAIDAIAPLLRDEATFERMAKPLFDLTGNLALLRQFNPGTANAIERLKTLAATNGRFADYRALRAELTQKRTAEFHERVRGAAALDVVGALASPPYTTDDEPLLRDALAALNEHPITEGPIRGAEVEALIRYALDHGLQPLRGLAAVASMRGSVSNVTRYRLAKALGVATDAPASSEPRDTWQHLGERNTINSVSWMERDIRGPSSIAFETLKSDEVPPYVEIYFDERRVAEGEVTTTRAFAIPSAAGVHRLEVILANPRTRNAEPRLVSVAP